MYPLKNKNSVTFQNHDNNGEFKKCHVWVTEGDTHICKV